MRNTLLVISYFLYICHAQTTLRDAAVGKHFHMGSAANAGTIRSGEANYVNTLGRQYNLLTAENGCKFDATEPQRGRFDFSQCDTVLNFAQQHNQSFRGHNLCWGQQNPSWLTNGNFNAEDKRSILKNHITNVMNHYGTKAIAWDVVNEAVVDSGTGPLKPTIWYPSVPDYIDVAFQTARATNPQVKLFYNDYNIASATGWSAAKSQKVYDMVKSMKNRGIPIDGVGFQLHVDLNYGPDMIQGIKQNMQRLADLGLEIHFTEMDIKCTSWSTAVAQQQATIYANLLQACIDQPKCTNFETWGFTDKYTWLGSNTHPLIFDENYAPKAAFNSLLATLKK